MNRILTAFMVVLLALSPAAGGEASEGLIMAINKATTMKCVKWTLVLNGDEIYHFKSDIGDITYVMVKRTGHQGKFAFLELRFSQDSKINDYSLKKDLGGAYLKLKKMIENIRIEDVEDNDVRRSLPYLVERL